jgi:hypothetical protein
MAIVSKGSGGSIKFTGTGGGISITSSGGGGGGGPTDPSLTNLVGWYRADDIGLSNGASVTGWDDRQGTSDLTRVYNGPIYYNSSNSEFNNQPTLDFGSAGYGGLIDNWNTPSFNLGPRLAGNTIIMVVKPTYEGGGGNHLLWASGGYPYDSYGYNIYANDMGGALGSCIRMVGYNGSGTILKTVEPNKPLIIYLSYEYDTNTSTNTLQIFGASSTFVPEWSWGGASLMSGGGNTGDGVMPIYGTPWKFQLGYTLGTSTAEVLYYNAVQGAQEKTDTIAYLASRYGIPV